MSESVLDERRFTSEETCAILGGIALRTLRQYRQRKLIGYYDLPSGPVHGERHIAEFIAGRERRPRRQ